MKVDVFEKLQIVKMNQQIISDSEVIGTVKIVRGAIIQVYLLVNAYNVKLIIVYLVHLWTLVLYVIIQTTTIFHLTPLIASNHLIIVN